MPRTPIDFSKTVIYKICCNDANITDCYIGHTTNIIRRRYDHKSICNNEKSKDYNLKRYSFIREKGGWFNFSIIIIEEYPCENINEARIRERYWIEQLKPSLNSDIPGRTKKQYTEDNKEIIAEKKKQYREKNKEKIAEKKKQYAEENKEIIAEKSKQYYEKNKTKILERVKHYSEENKEIIAEKSKQYREKNKEIIAEKKKEYLEKNKEEIYRKANERIRCECCDVDVPRKHLSTHNKSIKHQKKLSDVKVETK